MSEPTIFLIRPYRGGWQAFESPGVEPYYVGPKAKEQAISYVLNCRIAHRYGEIRVVDKDGNTLEVIPFDELANEPRSPSAAVSDLVSR